MRNLALVAVVTVMAIAGGCGGGAPATGPISAELKEFSITLGRNTTSTGVVQFAVRNAGAVIHEFVVIDTDTPAASLPVEGQGVSEAGMTVVDEIEDIAIGATPTLDVNLAAGHYAIICNIDGHYAAGMHADLTVQ